MKLFKLWPMLHASTLVQLSLLKSWLLTVFKIITEWLYLIIVITFEVVSVLPMFNVSELPSTSLSCRQPPPKLPATASCVAAAAFCVSCVPKYKYIYIYIVSSWLMNINIITYTFPIQFNSIAFESPEFWFRQCPLLK